MPLSRLLALVVVIILLAPLTPSAALSPVPPPLDPGDENWATGPGGAGTIPPVRALVVAPDGTLYVGGQFVTIGGVTANRVARWDGTTWSALGSGMNNHVFALALAPDGTLYAGGQFLTAGGVTVNRVARWDGTTWSALGSGTNSLVQALAVAPDGTLYAGGLFLTAGGVSTSMVARWDGTTWSALGSGMNGTVMALAVAPDGTLYAGGQFTTAGGVTVNRAARWDGASWSALGSGMNNTVNTLTLAPDGTLYAGGAFTTAGGLPAAYVARWDGTTWSALGSGMNNMVTALALGSDGSLYAGGQFTTADGVAASGVARWNGTDWRALGSGVIGSGLALALPPSGTLIVGGSFTTAGGVAASNLAQWTAAVGTCTLPLDTPVTLYLGNRPVTITVRTAGTLNCVSIQRDNKDHPNAAGGLQTHAFWEIRGTTSAGAAASGFSVDLTLPGPPTADPNDRVCRWTGSAWDCAATTVAPGAITRTGVTEFSPWAIEDQTPTALPWALSRLTASQATVLAGATLIYQLTVGAPEGGPFTATLTLDPRLTLEAAPSMQVAGSTLMAAGQLAPGQRWVVPITVRVRPEAMPGALRTQATIQGLSLSRDLDADVMVQAVDARMFMPRVHR